MDIPRDKNYPAGAVQCDECGGIGRVTETCLCLTCNGKDGCPKATLEVASATMTPATRFSHQITSPSTARTSVPLTTPNSLSAPTRLARTRT